MQRSSSESKVSDYVVCVDGLIPGFWLGEVSAQKQEGSGRRFAGCLKKKKKKINGGMRERYVGKNSREYVDRMKRGITAVGRRKWTNQLRGGDPFTPPKEKGSYTKRLSQIQECTDIFSLEDQDVNADSNNEANKQILSTSEQEKCHAKSQGGDGDQYFILVVDGKPLEDVGKKERTSEVPETGGTGESVKLTFFQRVALKFSLKLLLDYVWSNSG